MKRKSFANIFNNNIKDYSILLICIFFFILGLSIGIFGEILLSPEEKESLQSFIDLNLFSPQIADLPHVFLASIIRNLGLLLIIAISGLTIIGFPAALLVLIYKGAALGFTASLFIDTLGTKGVVLILLSLVPQNIILIPVFLIAVVASLKIALSVLGNSPMDIKKGLRERASSFIALIFILSIFLVGGCLIESFISPFLQQLLI
ncbi:MAG: hypothetical protein GX363_00785 [Clostridiales bacterium]|nr:hypothetical protein [Clostridiales bacterium]